ncbi:metal-dependent hydrolase [Halomarina pelagica]|uniref:metal-dependent hydrolase n=1 Tax=Halomarina pelagica TaxID=2961599 RepID=UPI0020C2A2AB|nr:metal-dependent hydrolase [Halomarina sp. BND7]
MHSEPTLTYYGLSSFEIEFDGTRLLVDPWIEEPDWSSLTVEDFEDVDYVFVTHGAYDHVGDTRAIASRSGATVITEPALADHLRDEGVPPERVRSVIWGNTFEEAGIEIRVLETRHLSYFESGGDRLSGMPLGFYFGFPERSLYYAGDTSLFGDLRLFAERYEPDTVLLPVGGAPGDLAPLPPDDAAVAASWLDVETIVPVHYVPGSGEVEAFEAELDGRVDRSRRPEIRPLDVGERYVL